MCSSKAQPLEEFAVGGRPLSAIPKDVIGVLDPRLQPRVNHNALRLSYA